MNFGLTPEEQGILRALSTPGKIQEFLDTLPMNHERAGRTYYSPRRVLRERLAHCIEGALLAAAALWLHGEEPLILDLQSVASDDDHVVTLFRRRGRWGALSKTNHPVLRYRDPVYPDLRSLALSYFHEYFFVKNGKKTLRTYSRPLNLRRFGTSWITTEADCFPIAEALNNMPHYPLLPENAQRLLRPATSFERRAAGIVEWPE